MRTDQQIKKINFEWIILFICILAAVVRILNAALHIRMIFPDEQFQTLEMAHLVVSHFAWVTWEWVYRIRDWAVPGLYVPLLWVLKWFGYDSGPVSIFACRIFTAVMGSLVFWRLNTLYKQSGFHFSARFIALLFMASASAMIAFGSSTFSDTWAYIFLWLLMPDCVNTLTNRDLSVRNAFVWGCLLGLLFCIRFQMLIWQIGVGICLIFFAYERQTRWRSVVSFALGSLFALFLEGLLDYDTWGQFFISPIQNFKLNMMNHVATLHGTSPWYFYEVDFWRLIQPTALVFCVLVLYQLVWQLKKSFKNNRTWHISWDPMTKRHFLILFPAVFFLLVHSVIDHKEFRFILPMIPALYYFLALSLNHWQRWDGWLRSHWQVTSMLGLICLVFLAGWLQMARHLGRDDFYYLSDLSDLSLTASQHGLLNHAQNKCLLFIDVNNVCSRGNMIYPVPTKAILRFDRNALLKEKLPDCPYAFVSGGDVSFFQRYFPRWALLQLDAYGNGLFYQIRVASNG